MADSSGKIPGDPGVAWVVPGPGPELYGSQHARVGQLHGPDGDDAGLPGSGQRAQRLWWGGAGGGGNWLTCPTCSLVRATPQARTSTTSPLSRSVH